MKSGPRSLSRSAKQAAVHHIGKSDHVDGTTAANESDTAADTCCAGMNHRLITATGQICNVQGFNEDVSVDDIPVATTATAYTDKDSGLTYILIFNQTLYFGGQMDHSLINPNQVRASGIVVSDDPFDKSRDFGIHLDEVFIPFMTRGSKVYVDTHVPTQEELDNCPWIEMTDDTEWDPNSVNLGHESNTYGDHHSDNLKFIKAVSSKRGRDEFQGMTSESDMVLGSVCESLVPSIALERMISAVNVHDVKPKKRKNKKEQVAHGPRTAKKVTATTRHSVITTDHLARTFRIGLNKAKQLVDVTTQKGVRTSQFPMTRRYRTDHLHLHRRYLKGKWYIDWLQSGVKSIDQAKGAFVYSDGTYPEVYPKEDHKQGSAAESLRSFCDDVGIPQKLKSDLASEFVGRNSEFNKLAKKKDIELSYAEHGREHQIWQVDVTIRELKKRWHKDMIEKKVPRRLWSYGIKYAAKVMQILPSRRLNNRTPYEVVHGHTPDISELADFGFYDLVWAYDTKHPGVGDEDRMLARWLGVSSNVGSDMCYWIMPVSGKAIARTTVQHVTREDMLNPVIAEQVETFDKSLTDRLYDENHLIEGMDSITYNDDSDLPQWDDEDPAYGDDSTTPTVDEYGNMIPIKSKDVEDIDSDTYDQYIGATYKLDEGTNNGGNIATVKRRATDIRGNMIGKSNANPLLDTALYEVELEDGTMDRIFANTIANNIYSQLDNEGKEILVMNEIIDHRKDGTAINKEPHQANNKPRKTTKGWQVLIEWKDESTSWVDLIVAKEANPIELAEYAVANKIDDEPAFAWWVPYTLKKRNRIISKTKSKYWKTTHKYGIRIPRTPEEALQLDAINGNHFWEEAMNKEMKKAQVAYEPRDDVTPEDVRRGKVEDMKGYQEIKCRIIFDVKMDFTRKARYVAGGHTTEAPVALTYSSVVSRDSVRLAFLIAALNDLDVSCCDIGNAYLNAPCQEKIWFVAGPECGEHRGKTMVLVRALYGLKSSGASWRSMFKEFIEQSLGFESTIIDSDAYRRRSNTGYVQPAKGDKPTDDERYGSAKRRKIGDGKDYYELLLVYVDDVLVISHNTKAIMDEIGTAFEIKNGETGPPKRYLGADTEQFQKSDTGAMVWSMKCDSYIAGALQTVKDLLKEDGRELKSGARSHKGPLPPTYKPELDITDECDAEHISRFQQLIGILRWAVELGRIDIQLEVSLLSSYSASPREGHLEALYLIFHYLNKNPKKRLVLDPAMPEIDESAFNDQLDGSVDWTEFYGYAKEEDPRRMPEPLGNPIKVSCFVDSDHASNVVSRRSHTGIMLFANKALIKAFCKRQNTVESSTFGSELVALRIARDLIVELRIKLKMFGVPIDGPANVFCDNNGVVKNTSIPESTLNKKHNSINYHVVREAAAAGILRVGKEDTATNLADALTKILPYSRKMELLGPLLYDY